MSVKIIGGTKWKAALNAQAARMINARKVQIGFFPTATYDDGTPVAGVAAVQEFGTVDAGKGHNTVIPGRPFFREAIAEGKPDYSKMITASLKVTGGNAEKALTVIGRKIQTDVQESIRNWSEPPNATSTVKQKGFNDPLIGKTRRMVNSVQMQVDGDG